jgi:hypothetical protein
LGIFASEVEFGTIPTTCMVRTPIWISSPTWWPSVLDTATSPGVDGSRPSDTLGMPSPCAGAPNAVTFRLDEPSFTVDGAHANGAATATPGTAGTQEWSGRPVFDHERIYANGIDGSLSLDMKAVRKSRQDERHREHQSGAYYRDDEAPHSPLHIAQSREQHVQTLPPPTVVDQALQLRRLFSPLATKSLRRLRRW